MTINYVILSLLICKIIDTTNFYYDYHHITYFTQIDPTLHRGQGLGVPGRARARGAILRRDEIRRQEQRAPELHPAAEGAPSRQAAAGLGLG